jgi:hypothetical protein
MPKGRAIFLVGLSRRSLGDASVLRRHGIMVLWFAKQQVLLNRFLTWGQEEVSF